MKSCSLYRRCYYSPEEFIKRSRSTRTEFSITKHRRHIVSMDLTEAFAPGGGGEDLPKTDFFDFVVSPPPHCASNDGDEESFLHRPGCRSIGYLQQTHEDHESSRELHGSPFIKETNNNTLTALPPVSTITGSLSHHQHHHSHHQVRSQHTNVQHSSETAMEHSECDYWGPEDENKEQTCNILLEDLNKYCWSTNSHTHTNDSVIHPTVSSEHHQGVTRDCSTNDRQNTDGAIYTLTVLNNEANSMDGLDCCKSPAPTSSDSWSLRPNLDLDAILSMEPSSGDQDHEQATNEVSRSVNERFHVERFTVPTSQYATDDSGFVESKELCARTSSANCSGGDNNNDWKLSDQNLQEVAAAAAAAVAVGAGDSAESLLRSALQGKLYTGPAQSPLPSSSPSSQASTISMPVSGSAGLIVSDQQQQQQQQQQRQQQQQQQQEEPMQACTDEDLLLSQLEQTTYRPDDYEKLKSIANEVVESYCSLEPVCNVSATTTVMYTLDPTSGSLGTITLPADLGQVSTVTVVTAAQQDVLQQQSSQHADVDQQQQQQQQSNQLQITSRVAGSSKPAKKYCRRANRNNNANSSSNGNTGSDTGTNAGGQQQIGSSGSPGSVQRKERSLHYCSICSKGFKDKYSVNVHIRTHTGEKPFACSLCGKSFRQKAHLAKHYQTHVTQKPSIQQSGGNGGSNENSSPTAETTTTTTSSSLVSRNQVAVDPSGTVCNPPS